MALEERLRHLAALDLERQPLGDGRLADAGVADEERVVLLPPGEDLDDAGDLVLAADERVDALLRGLLVEVDRVGLERVLRRASARPRRRSVPPVLLGSSASSSTFETPCEMYETTSSRVTPPCSRMLTAKESRSAKMRDENVRARDLFLAAKTSRGSRRGGWRAARRARAWGVVSASSGRGSSCSFEVPLEPLLQAARGRRRRAG